MMSGVAVTVRADSTVFENTDWAVPTSGVGVVTWRVQAEIRTISKETAMNRFDI
jgi:hypothetical protein